MSAVEIHRQLTEVQDSDIMSVQMVRKWCQEFRKGQHKVHNESSSGGPKVGTDESVNMIRATQQKSLFNITRAGNDNER